MASVTEIMASKEKAILVNTGFLVVRGTKLVSGLHYQFFRCLLEANRTVLFFFPSLTKDWPASTRIKSPG